MTKSEIVKMIEKAYQKLDNITSQLDEANDVVKEVFGILEELPSQVDEIEDDPEEVK